MKSLLGSRLRDTSFGALHCDCPCDWIGGSSHQDPLRCEDLISLLSCFSDHPCDWLGSSFQESGWAHTVRLWWSGHPQPPDRDGYFYTVDVLLGPTRVTSSPG